MLKNDWVRLGLTLAAATLLSFGLSALGIGSESLLMVYMVGVMCCAAITHGYRYSILCAAGGMMLFNYFFTVPLHTFHIDSRNDATLVIFFVVTAMLSAGMTVRFRQALRVSQENEKRAEQLFQEKEGARLEAERAQMRSSLLRSIGHDLRTPITGIQCGSSYLAEHGETLPRADIRKLAGDISDQATWMGNMVENILYMTRLDNKRLEVQRQNEVVDDVVGEAVSHVPVLSGRPFTCVLPDEVETVPMDGRMIVQVLVNLLDNAVRHTPAKSPIRLTVRPNGGNMEFCVEDGGTGVPPELREHLFDSFVTSGATGPDGKRGIGLGLSICRAVVQAHGGTIDAGRSELGGAKFTFTLPMEEP